MGGVGLGGSDMAREAPGKRLTTGLILLLAAFIVAPTVAPTVRLVADAALPIPCLTLPINRFLNFFIFSPYSVKLCLALA